MPTETVSRPAASEYAPYYGKYIEPVADQDPLPVLEARIDALDALRSMPDSRGLHRYGPDKWSVKEVVGHVTDAERVFAYRMLRIARGDETPLPGFEQNDYVAAANSDRLPLAGLVDGFRATRAATIALTREISADAWLRKGTASGFPVSARALLYIINGHLAHHLELLRERYEIEV